MRPREIRFWLKYLDWNDPTIEFCDKVGDGDVVQSEILVEAPTRLEEDLGTDRSDGVGSVHYHESENVVEDGVNS